MTWIRSVVNGNVVEESEDQAAFLVNAGLFVYLEGRDGAANPPAMAGVADPASPPPAPVVRRSRRRT